MYQREKAPICPICTERGNVPARIVKGTSYCSNHNKEMSRKLELDKLREAKNRMKLMRERDEIRDYVSQKRSEIATEASEIASRSSNSKERDDLSNDVLRQAQEIIDVNYFDPEEIDLTSLYGLNNPRGFRHTAPKYSFNKYPDPAPRPNASRPAAPRPTAQSNNNNEDNSPPEERLQRKSKNQDDPLLSLYDEVQRLRKELDMMKMEKVKAMMDEFRFVPTSAPLMPSPLVPTQLMPTLFPKGSKVKDLNNQEIVNAADLSPLSPDSPLSPSLNDAFQNVTVSKPTATLNDDDTY